MIGCLINSNSPFSQIPQCTCRISHNAPIRPERHFCSDWCIAGSGTGALWDFWIRSIFDTWLHDRAWYLQQLLMRILFWYPIIWSSHSNSLRDQVSVDEIYWYLNFRWILLSRSNDGAPDSFQFLTYDTLGFTTGSHYWGYCYGTLLLGVVTATHLRIRYP